MRLHMDWETAMIMLIRDIRHFWVCWDKYQPKYMVHGHMHLQYDHSLQRTMQYNNTQIINAI